MALTKTTHEVINISDISVALTSDLTANGINVLKAPKISPALTGIPTAPTANSGTSTTQLATTAFVNTISVSEFAAGTRAAFFQTAAPIGWTQVTTYTDHMLRVVSTAGGGIGGTHSPILMNVVPSHTHTMTGTTTSAGAHTHYYYYWGPYSGMGTGYSGYPANGGYWTNTTNASGAHSHTINASIAANSGAANWTPKYVNMIICASNGSSGSGGSSESGGPVGPSGESGVFQFIGYTNGANITSDDRAFIVNKPTNTTQGDLMLMLHEDAAHDSDIISLAGWTQVFTRDTMGTPTVMYKIAGVSEPSSYTFATTNNTQHISSIITIRGASTVSPIGTVATGDNSVVATSISPSVPSMLIAFYADKGGATGLSTPTNMIIAQANVGSTGNHTAHPNACSVYSFYQLVTAGATGTRTTNWTGTADHGIGVLLAVS